MEIIGSAIYVERKGRISFDNMIYPKFPRRTLALILCCLVITLGAVGVIFLVYFFNENNTLSMDSSFKTVYSDQAKNVQFKKNIFSKSHDKFASKRINEYVNENKNLFLSTSFGQKLVPNHEKQGYLFTRVLKPEVSKDSNSNSETIYIDDFDRPTYNSKSNDLGNIEYFDTILVDHKNDLKGNDKNQKIYKDTSLYKALQTEIGNRENSKINIKDNGSKIQRNKSHLFSYAIVEKKKINNLKIDDLEVDLRGSGSGDYIDDTEVNENKLRHVTKVTSKDNNNKSLNGYYPKGNDTLWGYSKHFANDNSNILSLPSVLATDARSISVWTNKKKFKKNKFYPTLSSNISKHMHSPSAKMLHSFSKLTNKKHMSPTINTNHRKLLINESNNFVISLPTSAYNTIQSQFDIDHLGTTSTIRVIESAATKLRDTEALEQNNELMETRTRRIMGNVKKSEERSRQLLLCEEAGGGELCRMLFKGHIND